ncbi:hypothetical protein [Gluconobacter kondonii]|uniref:hypothetical protein n=1 Tax=Gluconobacter kondonii TaxID=941463 RepID=UPI001B8C5F1A|nr:hypothetical protein [Gluconobacter kondonii]MBS1065970.1 hypothetical protein [Gluconobacter kondonii]MBS1082467.1 hypothetical protein [Gluconobacter kondonii]
MAAPLLLDMVLETATNPGTASFVLNGAVQDRRSFASAAPSGGQVFYFADDGTQAEWGVGTLTVGTPNMLSRQSIAGTTQNTTQALNFTGTVRVYSWLPSAYTPRLDGNGLLGVFGLQTDTLTVGKTAIVPAVSDWTTYQAVGAKDAYGAFLRLGGTAQISSSPTTFSNGLNTALGVSAWSTTNTQVMSVGDAYGAFLRNAGPAQTSSCPTVFTNGLTSSGSTGLSILAPLSGSEDITLKAGLRCGSSTIYVNSIVSDGGADLRVQTNLRLGNQMVYINNINIDGPYSRNIAGNTNVTEQWSFAQRPTVSGTSVALTSDMPLPAGRRIEAFIMTTTDGSRVNFPQGFSSEVDVVINITCQRSNGRVVVASWENVDAGGFTLGMQREDTNGASQQKSPWTIHVTAIGNS